MSTKTVGTVRETFPGERRVALVPGVIASLQKLGLSVQVEAGAGADAGFPDAAYESVGATIVNGRSAAIEAADVLLQVRAAGANPEAGRDDLARLRAGQIVIGSMEPLSALEPLQALAASGATAFAMELMPRISRAQSMDVLSSQATVAGYEAVLQAATALPKMFPMLMTAAGTVAPARVFVIGAGVAGLQAIATARKLGAVVTGYDIRPAVKEQVESLGAKFLVLEIEAGEAEDKGGYAKAMDEAFYRRQREMMAHALAESDVVITTAAVPGKKAPVLITEDMLKGMATGSVIVDLAAERGGNCDRTRADETVEVHGVRIMGPTNLPSAAPFHASQMYARNLMTFLRELVKEGDIEIDLGNEVIEQTLITRDGEIVQGRVREAHGLPALAAAEVAPTGSTN